MKKRRRRKKRRGREETKGRREEGKKRRREEEKKRRDEGREDERQCMIYFLRLRIWILSQIHFLMILSCGSVRNLNDAPMQSMCWMREIVAISEYWVYVNWFL